MCTFPPSPTHSSTAGRTCNTTTKSQRSFVLETKCCTRAGGSDENLHGRQVFESQAKHPASKKTDFPAKHEFVSWEYIHHNDGSSLHGQGVEVLPSGAVRIRQVPQPPRPAARSCNAPGAFQRRLAHFSAVQVTDSLRLRRMLYVLQPSGRLKLL